MRFLLGLSLLLGSLWNCQAATPVGAANWKANGTTNSTLRGIGSANELTATNAITLNGDRRTAWPTNNLPNTGTAGTYRSVTFDAQGRETAGTNPTTFAGYGISDTGANFFSAISSGKQGTGVPVFDTSPTISTSITITNAATGTVPFVINHASGATGPAFSINIGGSNFGMVTNDGSWLFPAGSATAPALAWAADADGSGTGWYRNAANRIAWAINGSFAGQFLSTGLEVSGGLTLGTDAVLLREAANTLALRNAANAQTFNVYNTYTDASNYERGFLDWITTANVLTLGTKALGTGTARSVTIQSANEISFRTSGANTRWKFDSNGHFLATTDNAFDIGASGATRPRNVNVAGTVISAGNIQTTAGNFNARDAGFFYWNSRSSIASPSDGVVTLGNNAATDFSRLQFGGTTASFPSLKRSTTAIQVRLADDSAYTVLTSGGVTDASNAAATTLGEVVSSNIAVGSAVSLTTATAANVTTISLTAGDWDVRGNINFSASSATVTGTSGGITVTSATVPTDGSEVYSGVQVTLLSETDSVTLPSKQINVNATTTVYLVGKSTFSAGSVAAFGSISARRIR